MLLPRRILLRLNYEIAGSREFREMRMSDVRFAAEIF
jgi:hypothetical protein